MLRVHFSNDAERLVGRLLDLMQEPPASPFTPEEVIVPSAGLGRWIEMRYADRHGVAANIRFGYPAQWLWRWIAQVAGTQAEVSPFSPEILAWRIFGWLGGEAPRRHARLCAYLARADEAMRWELAQRLGAQFDRYVTYRQDWLAGWAKGRPAVLESASQEHAADEAWQAELWRHVLAVSGLPAEHPAQRMFAALEAAGAQAASRFELPERAFVFGLPTLAPLYLEFFRRLAHWIEIDFLVLNPCREFWFDIVSDKQLARLAARRRAEHAESGNRLLAHWGPQAREFVGSMLDACDSDFEESWVERGTESLLHRVQQSLLELQDMPPGSLSAEDLDASITVQVCHSPMRELEVLQDFLLDRFSGDATLAPQDVLVVTPDLERAAPLIDAVFGAVREARHIPYRITGRAPSHSLPMVRILLELTRLGESRFEASEVLGLLQVPALARRFGLEAEDVDTIHRWLRECGVRWGLDAAHRRELGLPQSNRHSFDEGFARLFLGYAMPGEELRAFAGALPYDRVEGQSARVLGGLHRLMQSLRAIAAEVRERRSVAGWSRLVDRWLAELFEPDAEDLAEAALIRGAAAELARQARDGGYDEAMGADALRLALEAALERRAPGGVPSGRVTFTGMTPLRGLPYRIVCGIGMDHGAWPGPDSPAEFDLMAAPHRPGDPRRRHDERNVMLDLLLSARQALYLSYTGRGIRDNGAVPPSTLVSELLDLLVRAATPERAGDEDMRRASARLVTEHPLQPFSPRYFVGERGFFSYNAAYRDAAQALLRARAGAGRIAAPPFFAEALPEPGAEWREVTVTQLASFLRHPVRYLLRERLRINLDVKEEVPEDEEPFIAGDDATTAVGLRLLQGLLAGKSAESLRELAEHLPELPHGASGHRAFDQALRLAQAFETRLRGVRAEQAHRCLAVDLDVDGLRLAGELGSLHQDGQILWRFRKTGATDRLEAWVRHLVLCAASPPGVERVTQWLSPVECFHFIEVSDARERLGGLVGLYAEGLRRPLHFFPKSAFRYVEKGGDLAAAEKKWRVGPYNAYAESDDDYYRLAFGEAIDRVLDEEFLRLARGVFEPLLGAIREDIHAGPA